jgi:hypothetical protein
MSEETDKKNSPIELQKDDDVSCSSNSLQSTFHILIQAANFEQIDFMGIKLN